MTSTHRTPFRLTDLSIHAASRRKPSRTRRGIRHGSLASRSSPATERMTKRVSATLTRLCLCRPGHQTPTLLPLAVTLKTAHGQDRRRLSTLGLVSLILGECFAPSSTSRLLRDTISFSRPCLSPSSSHHRRPGRDDLRRPFLRSSTRAIGELPRPSMTSVQAELSIWPSPSQPAHGKTGSPPRVKCPRPLLATTPRARNRPYAPPDELAHGGRHRVVWSSTLLACHNISILAVGNGSAVVRLRDRLLASRDGVKRAELLPMALDRNC
jgi:hypothetical protein